jgi:flagellar hook-associated protein 1 FlgK
MTVFIGGQSPLVIGDHGYPLAADISTGQARILNPQGQDITGVIQQGRLRSILDTQNTVIPSITANLNLLAGSLADSVNNTLAAGVDRNGQPGAPLFVYDGTAGAAFTLDVTGVTGDELAAALPGAPGGNGNALALASLSGAPSVNGATFSGFYAAIGSSLGGALSAARTQSEAQTLVLAQARKLRSEETGVSLDEEAVTLIQFQRHYQATAQLFKALDEMTQELINIMR